MQGTGTPPDVHPPLEDIYIYLSTTEGCTSGGIYVPCMPSESYCKRLGSLLLFV